MLCAADGSSRPERGTNPHKTDWDVCTKRASTSHQKHASVRGNTVNTWGRRYDETSDDSLQLG